MKGVLPSGANHQLTTIREWGMYRKTKNVCSGLMWNGLWYGKWFNNTYSVYVDSLVLKQQHQVLGNYTTMFLLNIFVNFLFIFAEPTWVGEKSNQQIFLSFINHLINFHTKVTTVSWGLKPLTGTCSKFVITNLKSCLFLWNIKFSKMCECQILDFTESNNLNIFRFWCWSDKSSHLLTSSWDSGNLEEHKMFVRLTDNEQT